MKKNKLSLIDKMSVVLTQHDRIIKRYGHYFEALANALAVNERQIKDANDGVQSANATILRVDGEVGTIMQRLGAIEHRLDAVLSWQNTINAMGRSTDVRIDLLEYARKGQHSTITDLGARIIQLEDLAEKFEATFTTLSARIILLEGVIELFANHEVEDESPHS